MMPEPHLHSVPQEVHRTDFELGRPALRAARWRTQPKVTTTARTRPNHRLWVATPEWLLVVEDTLAASTVLAADDLRNESPAGRQPKAVLAVAAGGLALLPHHSLPVRAPENDGARAGQIRARRG